MTCPQVHPDPDPSPSACFSLTLSPQAFIVAFTSDMIPRLVYMYAYQPNGQLSMKGYINDSLSIFSIDQIPENSRPEPGENPAWFDSSITTCRWVWVGVGVHVCVLVWLLGVCVCVSVCARGVWLVRCGGVCVCLCGCGWVVHVGCM